MLKAHIFTGSQWIDQHASTIFHHRYPHSLDTAEEAKGQNAPGDANILLHVLQHRIYHFTWHSGGTFA